MLQQCKENAGEMQRLEQQIRIIRNAWEIFDCFELVQTNEKTLEQTETELKNLEERLPELVQQAEEGTRLEDAAREDNRKKNSIYSQVSERVGQALKQFQKMEDTQKDLEGQQNDLVRQSRIPRRCRNKRNS